MTLTARIEISKYSHVKYELKLVKRPDGSTREEFWVDRILAGAMAYPQNYGHIPETLDYDGDPLDAIILGNEPWVTGAYVKVRVLGVMPMIDQGDVDDKLICVIADDPRFTNIGSIADVDENILKEITNFFENYKTLENKPVKIGKISGYEKAKKVVLTCQEMYKKANKK